MTFSLSNNKSVLALNSDTPGKEINIYVSKEIPESEMDYASLNTISSWTPSDRQQIKIHDIKDGWKVSVNSEKKWRKWWIKFDEKSIIFPTREGEYISNLDKINSYHVYSLSYPGTASTKCVVIFTGNGNTGFVVCAEPNLTWAKISLTRLDNYYILQLLQHDQNLYIFPFENGWQEGVLKFRNLFFPKSDINLDHKILNTPRFLLQMGVRDFFGNSHISNFSELLPYIQDYRKSLGTGNIVHLFGTNPYGFDTLFPDFTIDKKLGGYNGFKKLIKDIHGLNLLVSHHFNPRIADSRWIEKNPEYKDAIVMNPSGNPWIEFYKNNIYYVMNPNNEKWLKLCVDTIKYFKKLGVDFVEIDQIAYQRNLYTKEGGFAKGYQKLLDLAHKESIKFWIEGVSDIFDLPEDCYSQVLPRDRMQMWENGENRRGYVYGTQFTLFYKTLMPKSSISYQIVTEKAKVHLIPRRLRLAQKLNAQIYDLELGFVDKTYKARLDKTLKKISKYLVQNKNLQNA